MKVTFRAEYQVCADYWFTDDEILRIRNFFTYPLRCSLAVALGLIFFRPLAFRVPTLAIAPLALVGLTLIILVPRLIASRKRRYKTVSRWWSVQRTKK